MKRKPIEIAGSLIVFAYLSGAFFLIINPTKEKLAATLLILSIISGAFLMGWFFNKREGRK